MRIEEKLIELKLELPPAPEAAGLYKTILVDGKMAIFSGHLPIRNNGSIIAGKVGSELSADEAGLAARQVGLNILATFKKHFGDFSRIEQVYKLLGMVNADSSFTEHPAVLNGCSKLFYDLLGDDRGVGVRSAYGVSGLPANAAVEIEGAFLLKE